MRGVTQRHTWRAILVHGPAVAADRCMGPPGNQTPSHKRCVASCLGITALPLRHLQASVCPSCCLGAAGAEEEDVADPFSLFAPRLFPRLGHMRSSCTAAQMIAAMTPALASLPAPLSIPSPTFPAPLSIPSPKLLPASAIAKGVKRGGTLLRTAVMVPV